VPNGRWSDAALNGWKSRRSTTGLSSGTDGALTRDVTLGSRWQCAVRASVRVHTHASSSVRDVVRCVSSARIRFLYMCRAGSSSR
jgi:hypothetical protein